MKTDTTTSPMKHHFYFTGYSDDVVIAGPGTATKGVTDEHYSTFYRMSNGALVKAIHAPDDDPEHPGWKITCDHPNAIRLPAPGEDEAHNDGRIPHWMEPHGYCDVLILESNEPLTIVEQGDKEPPAATPERMLVAKFTKALAEVCTDLDDPIELDDLAKALKTAKLTLVPAP